MREEAEELRARGHAELGDFQAATRLQEEALALAPAHRAGGCGAGFELYQKGEPIRDSAPAGLAYPFADGSP